MSETYRGVPVPDKLWGTLEQWKHSVDLMMRSGELDAPMSPDVAQVVLRMAIALHDEGRGAYPASLVLTGSPDEVDEDAVIRRAADIVGRDRIKDRDLLKLLAEIDDRDSQKGRD